MGYVLKRDAGELRNWIRDEIEFKGEIQKGKRGIAARRIQEWLCLHDIRLLIDGDFGIVTELSVQEFQQSNGLPQSGKVDEQTWSALIAPMLSVLQPFVPPPGGIRTAMLDFAKQHLKAHPREVGGQNKGPWVRLYMSGNEGRDWPWCAGFVTFVMNQASELTELPKPIRGSVSCDSLAEQAKNAGLFAPESQLGNQPPPPGAIFLVRRTSTDWTHTGLVSAAEPSRFFTIEGNTNDEGHREGYEVCSRRHAYSARDFIIP